MLLRVHQGQGRQARAPLLAARLRAARRASWKLSRPPAWLCAGTAAPQPRPIATAQTLSSHAQRTAGIPHGQGLPPLRHCWATPRWAAGGDRRTIPRLRGQRSIDTTTRALHSPRQPLAKGHRPCDRRCLGETPGPQTASRQAGAPHRLAPSGAARGPRPTAVGSGRRLAARWGHCARPPAWATAPSQREARYPGLASRCARGTGRTGSAGRL